MKNEIYITTNMPKGLFLVSRDYDLQSLNSAIEKFGYVPQVVDTSDMSAYSADLPFAAINGTGWLSDSHCAYLRRLELQGVRIANSPYNSKMADDKLFSYIECKAASVPTIPTMFLELTNPKGWESMIANIQENIGLPAVVKVTNSSRGIAVYKVNTVDDLNDLIGLLFRGSLLEANFQPAISYIIQKYVAEAAGKVYRVLVIGDEYVGGVLRTNDQNWKAGVTPVNSSVLGQQGHFGLGEQRSPFDVSPELKELSLKVCKTLGINFAAIDFFNDGEKYVLNEINTSPDLKTFDQCNFIRGYEILIDYLIRRPANF